jgi:iron(III) transport system ATP-binding protein
MSRRSPSSVEFRSVSKRYGAVTAVDNLSFSIPSGTLVTLLGPSGCGKTTTLRLIAGLELPSKGEIRIADKDVSLLSAAERDVSMVFQSYALFPHMTVLENVAYGPTVSGAKKRDAHAMAAEKLAVVGLAGLEQRLPSELSGGQQQGWQWPGRWCSNRRYFCSTSHSPILTRNCAGACVRTFADCSSAEISRSPTCARPAGGARRL